MQINIIWLQVGKKKSLEPLSITFQFQDVILKYGPSTGQYYKKVLYIKLTWIHEKGREIVKKKNHVLTLEK